MSHSTNIDQSVAQTRPPAKLNLFLELLARRDDGYHDIDTIMVAIDWCDELTLRRSEDPNIALDVDWIPSTEVIARRLGIEDDAIRRESLLGIPTAESNLVYRALEQFRGQFEICGGFHCTLRKRIPAGAGMGGASSDAASALLCASKLCGIGRDHEKLHKIASSIGSDVPFFLGPKSESGVSGRISAARARGRGEQIEAIDSAAALPFVVVFPAESLSTAAVYAQSHIPGNPSSGGEMLMALRSGQHERIINNLCNRLSAPARKIVPVIDEILDSMWRSGLRACQLTGSGSACFAIAKSPVDARRCASRLRATLEPGALVSVASCTPVPAIVSIP